MKRVKILSIVSAIILFYFLSISLTKSQEGKVYSLLLHIFRNDTIILKDLSIIYSLPTHFPTIDSGYYIEILSNERKVLIRENLPIYFTLAVFRESKAETKSPFPLQLDEIVIDLRLPYFENGKWIAIYHLDKKIFEMDLSQYLCNNNGKCEENRGETLYICPNDCKAPNLCGNRICEWSETQENCCKDCGCPRGFNCIDNECIKVFSPKIYLFLIFLVGILAVAVIFLTRKIP